MTSTITYLSVLSFVYFNPSHAQEGIGCAFTTCDTPGQVRINAVFDANNHFIGGCNCGCDPAIGTPSSAVYCEPPNVVNINPFTLRGDCSCNPPDTNPQGVEPAPQTPDYGISGATQEVLCAEPGVCECSLGHRGPCIITCDGAEACLEQDIDCNNDGFPCTVNCNSETACEGATFINGPLHGSLSVNCMGEFACEGGTTFNGAKGTDLIVACDGATACADGIFKFGFRRGIVSCNGDPESCSGATFIMYPNAANTVGVAFACMGLFCPPEAPKAFSNAVGPVTQTCPDSGPCACPPGTNGECTLNCKGNVDACKDGLLECNNDGHACFVNCNEGQSCSGATNIVGPTGGALTVNCIGKTACEGAVTFDGQYGTDMTVICGGRAACKGSPGFHYGSGIGKLECNGQPDSCQGSPVFNLPASAQGFSCTGMVCPPEAPFTFNNLPLPRVDVVLNTPIVNQPNGNQPLVVAEHCCVPSIPGFKQWRGMCWGYTDEIGCNAEQGRCVWDYTQCLAIPPTCSMSSEMCSADTECCSELCVFPNPTANGECM